MQEADLITGCLWPVKTMSARLLYSIPAFLLAVGFYLFARQPQAGVVEKRGEHPRIPILLFHDVDGKGPYAISRHEFRQYLDILKEEKIQVISLARLHEMMQKKIPAERPSVVITIDDDFKNIVRVAAPMLREYGYPATFFVYTKNITDQPRQGMAWEDLRRLQKEGFDIQNHSHTHTAFHVPREGESAEQHAARVDIEILHSRNVLEDRLGHKIWSFAYPMGYHSPYLEKRLKDAGYELLLTTDANPPDVTKTYTGVLDRFTIQKGKDPFGLFYKQIAFARRTLDDHSLTLKENETEPRP